MVRAGVSRLLPQAFYARDALEVAHDLLGQHLHASGVVLRITEVEAYCHPDDSASHCRMGRTPRNAPMWGPPGHAYVYLCYGMHSMLNLVTNREGEGAAVLIRACEPISGVRLIERRRGQQGPASLTGPGKVTSALAVDCALTGRRVYRSGPLEVRAGKTPNAILSGPRIGISYARPEHQRALWRFAVAESAWVSERASLVELPANSHPLACSSVPPERRR